MEVEIEIKLIRGIKRVIKIRKMISISLQRVDIKRDMSGSRLHDMMIKMLQQIESTNVGIKEIYNDIYNMTQIADSHSISMK